MAPNRGLRARLIERAPTLALSVWFYRSLRRQARAYRAAGADERAPEELLKDLEDPRMLAFEHSLIDARPGFASMVAVQKRGELVPLLERLTALAPLRVCEIGTATGGTLYLWTRVAAPEALILSLDIHNPPQGIALRRRFCRPGQRLVGIAGDSSGREARAAVERELAGELLDFLFIDGDHSYDGVRADFDSYAPLVRAGGLIALHDVNADRREWPDGREPVSGEVPRFWKELRESRRTEELIAEPDQHGFGIGLVWV